MDARPPATQLVTFLYTPDLAASRVFYEAVLGLDLALDQGSCLIFSVTREAFLGVCANSATQQDSPGHGRRKGVIVTLVSDEVDAWHDRLRAAGAAIEKPPTYNAEYDIYHVFVRDPAGYLIEIQQFRSPDWPRVGRPSA
jgi:catechol 2,3-dioxygenase-like lactoylglutathione lyase family enzyme